MNLRTKHGPPQSRTRRSGTAVASSQKLGVANMEGCIRLHLSYEGPLTYPLIHNTVPELTFALQGKGRGLARG